MPHPSVSRLLAAAFLLALVSPVILEPLVAAPLTARAAISPGTKDAFAAANAYATGLTIRAPATAGSLAAGVPSAFAAADKGTAQDSSTRPAFVLGSGTSVESRAGKAAADAFASSAGGATYASFALEGLHLAGGLVRLTSISGTMVSTGVGSYSTSYNAGQLIVAGQVVPLPLPGTTQPIPGGRLSMFTVESQNGRPVLVGLRLVLDTGDEIVAGTASATRSYYGASAAFAPVATASALGGVPLDPNDRGITVTANGEAARGVGATAWDAPKDAFPGILDAPVAVAPAGGVVVTDIEEGAARATATMRVPNVDLLGGLVTALDVVSTASATADAGGADLSGGATFGVLRLGGVAIGPNPPQNTVYDLGFARVVLNEQSRSVSEDPATGRNRAVGSLTAMRITITAANPIAPVGTEYIVARTGVDVAAYRPAALDLSVVLDRTVVHANDDVPARITVANPGETHVNNVLVRQAGVTLCSLGTVRAHAVVTCAATLKPNVDTLYTFVANGADGTGRPVTDSVSRFVDVLKPRITLSARTLDLTVHRGETARYEFTVTNAGDADLRDVVVQDARVGRVCVLDLLPVGAVRVCVLETPVDAGGSHTSTVQAVDALGLKVTASSSITDAVIRPALDLELTLPPPGVVRAGTNVVFPLRVRNTGDVALSTTRIELDGATLCNLGTLAVGATNTCALTRPVGATRSFQFNATAIDTLGARVVDSVRADVRVISPGLAVAADASRFVTHADEAVTLTYTATNVGNSPLAGVSIADSTGSVCSGLALAPGATVSCSRTRLFITPAISTATASATDETGALLSAPPSSVSVDVVTPSVRLALSADRSVARPGDIVRTTYTVTNNGNTGLYDLDVLDGLLGGVCVLPTLTPGGTSSCSAQGPARASAVTSQVCGVDGLGREVCAQATLTIALADGELYVDIVPSAYQVHAGDVVTYTVTIGNAGTTAVSSLVLRDAAGATLCTRTTLAAGQTTTCTYSRTLSTTNTQTVTATATDGAGTLTASDATTVTVLDPRLTLAVGITPAIVPDNGTATYRFTVTNTGNALLRDIAVGSDVTGPVCTVAALEVGLSAVCTSAAVVNVATARTAAATATGRDELGRSVTATAGATLSVSAVRLDVSAPVQELERLAGEHPVVTFTFTVQNVGHVPLTALSVRDGTTPVCTIASLAAGAAATCTRVLQLDDSYLAVGTVTGRDAANNVLSWSDSHLVEVFLIGLSFTKTPSHQFIEPGTVVTYTYNATNTGETALLNVTLSDDRLGDVCFLRRLAPGDSFVCTATETLQGTTRNVGAGEAETPLGRILLVSRNVTVYLGNWSIVIEKTAWPDEPEIHWVLCGSEFDVACFPRYEVTPVTYTYRVTNTGTIPLAFNVTDDHLGRICHGAIAAGETWTCNVTVEVWENTTNVADVIGLTPLGRRVDASASATVTIRRPAIRIDVDLFPLNFRLGEVVVVTYTVTNVGDTWLFYVQPVDDRFLAPGQCFLKRLAPGQSYACSIEQVYEGPHKRIAGVFAESPLGVRVTDTQDYLFGDPCTARIYPDAMGYVCAVVDQRYDPSLFSRSTRLGLGDDQLSPSVRLPWAFVFEGVTYGDFRVSSNGFLIFDAVGNQHGCCAGRPVPDPAQPNNAIFVWHGDLNPAAGGQVRYGLGSDGAFLVEWADVPHFGGTNLVLAQAALYPDGTIEVRHEYAETDGQPHTVGIEDAAGTSGVQGLYTTLPSYGTTFRFFT